MKTIDVSSPDNRLYKRFLTLKTARGARKHSLAIVSGLRQTEDVARDFPSRCEALICSAAHGPIPRAFPESMIRYRLSRELFRELDLFETGQPLLVVRFPPFPRLEEGPWPSGCTLCVPFQDPANVGSVIRAAAAFGVSRVVVLKEAAHPFHPKAVRASGGHVFRVPLVAGPRLSDLAPKGAQLVTLSPTGEDVAAYRFPPKFCLVPGLEGPGLPETLRNAQALSIPMANGVDSLNAAMATGIVLYLWRRGMWGD